MKKGQHQPRQNKRESEKGKARADAHAEAGPSTCKRLPSPAHGSSASDSPHHSSPSPAPDTSGVVDASDAPDAPDAAATTTPSRPNQGTLALKEFKAAAPLHFFLFGQSNLSAVLVIPKSLSWTKKEVEVVISTQETPVTLKNILTEERKGIFEAKPDSAPQTEEPSTQPTRKVVKKPAKAVRRPVKRPAKKPADIRLNMKCSVWTVDIKIHTFSVGEPAPTTVDDEWIYRSALRQTSQVLEKFPPGSLSMLPLHLLVVKTVKDCRPGNPKDPELVWDLAHKLGRGHRWQDLQEEVLRDNLRKLVNAETQPAKKKSRDEWVKVLHL
ncbi:hypothetical protein BO78DRAFT_420115 [Aspergillus sclerotiicarbonarius CBS 121057]|uniref:Uncharacterized protein n=1 Tax=Aspergillus sclerotiicarbonarius (strain CBS 121057 / IBT 28362) TaxID=1448318 RepID=A0A319EED1_ASPSB|nr:hypothetical protein BO78DRAFT_420115 [Aspergillus sclerotiicarbonarius CBS 121057]